KRGRSAEINEEPSVLGGRLTRHRSSSLDAETIVPLRTWNAGSSRGRGRGSLDAHGTRGRGRSTCVIGVAQTRGVRLRASAFAVAFLFVLCGGKVGEQQDGQ